MYEILFFSFSRNLLVLIAYGSFIKQKWFGRVKFITRKQTILNFILINFNQRKIQKIKFLSLESYNAISYKNIYKLQFYPKHTSFWIFFFKMQYKNYLTSKGRVFENLKRQTFGLFEKFFPTILL